MNSKSSEKNQMKALLTSLLLLCHVFLFAQETPAVLDSSLAVPKHYLVGVKESPPFVLKDGKGQWAGISIYLWEAIAKKLDYSFEYVELNTLAELMQALDSARVDIAINPLTVTSDRIEHIAFTQPFFISNSIIVTRNETKDKVLGFFGRLFSKQFVQAICLLFFVLFIFGLLVWLFERKHNSQFEKGLRGIWSGVWWSATTMTTVGYGDKAPQTIGGQIVGLFWMFGALLIISGFLASIASALTVEQLEEEWKDLNHLRRVEVGSVEASASRAFLNGHFIKSHAFSDTHEGLKSLKKGEIEAFVYDEPILRYEIERDSQEYLLRILPFEFNTQYYSFGLPRNSQNVKEINPVLLEVIEDLRWKVVLADHHLREF